MGRGNCSTYLGLGKSWEPKFQPFSCSKFSHSAEILVSQVFLLYPHLHSRISSWCPTIVTLLWACRSSSRRGLSAHPSWRIPSLCPRRWSSSGRTWTSLHSRASSRPFRTQRPRLRKASPTAPLWRSQSQTPTQSHGCWPPTSTTSWGSPGVMGAASLCSSRKVAPFWTSTGAVEPHPVPVPLWILTEALILRPCLCLCLSD